MAHGAWHGQRKEVLDALLVALEAVDRGHEDLRADSVLAALPEAALDYLEDFMASTHRFRSEFARRYYSQGEVAGEARGEAKAVLVILDARGIEVPDGIREDITDCTDLGQLETWIRRAVTASKVDELFG
jgi:hypothetical protein